MNLFDPKLQMSSQFNNLFGGFMEKVASHLQVVVEKWDKAAVVADCIKYEITAGLREFNDEVLIRKLSFELV